MHRAAFAGAVGLALWLPQAAPAATVGTENPGVPYLYAQTATLTFDAAADGDAPESVELSIAGTEGDQVRYRIHDASGTLTATTGCTGGGLEVECLLPRSRPGTGCNHLFCSSPAQGISLEFRLGGGDDSFSFPATEPGDGGGGPFVLRLGSGAGDDLVETGAEADRVDPGSGADTVRTGAGDDLVIASPGAADGADRFELGDGIDTATYADAPVPVDLSLDGAANDGIAGDGDNLVAVEHAIGGLGDDLITGSDQPAPAGYVHDIGLENEILEGGGGSDRIDGRGGPDYLVGGSATVFAGDGDDTLIAGRGSDVVLGGPGNDTIAGGPARDTIGAGPGRDRASGGGGDDRVAGAGGRDRVSGGNGDDVVEGGFAVPDVADDAIDCGRGDDRAIAEKRDRVRRCERIKRPVVL